MLVYEKIISSSSGSRLVLKMKKSANYLINLEIINENEASEAEYEIPYAAFKHIVTAALVTASAYVEQYSVTKRVIPHPGAQQLYTILFDFHDERDEQNRIKIKQEDIYQIRRLFPHFDGCIARDGFT